MPHQLSACELLAADFKDPVIGRDIAGFSCGNEPWCLAANRWLNETIDNQAIPSMAKGTKVWLYYADSLLVGFGSLGPMLNRPTKGFIPQLAIAEGCQHQPAGDKHWRYSQQIMRHILSQARALGYDGVALWVDDQNARATRFYEQFQFQQTGKQKKAGDRQLLQMAITLG